MATTRGASHLARLNDEGWSTVSSDPLTRSPELDDRIARLQARGRASTSARPTLRTDDEAGSSDPLTRSPELDDRIARLQARGRASTSARPTPPSRRKPPMPPGPAASQLPTSDENDENGSTATVTFLTPLSEEPRADEHVTEVLSLEPLEESTGWLPGVATSMAIWRPNWSVSRSVATGASAVSFAAMVVAMGPLLESAGESETTTGGEPAVGDPATAGEQPAPSPSVGIVTAPVDPATAALLPSTEGVPVPDPLADADPTNPAVDPASTGATAAPAPAQAAPAATAPPATAAPAAAGGGGGTPAPQPTAAPQPADPAPTAAPTTAAPATQPPATASPTTAAPTTAAPTTPAPTQPPTTAAQTTPPPSSGGSG